MAWKTPYAICVKPHLPEFLSECGSPQVGAISTRGAIAKRLTLDRQKHTTSVTGLMSDGWWGGLQYLTREPRAEIASRQVVERTE